MSARLGTLSDSHGLVAPQFVSTGWTDIDFTDIFAGRAGPRSAWSRPG